MLLKKETSCALFVALTGITLFIGQSSATSISPQERRDLVDQRLEDNEEYKKRCKHGEYWSFVVKECKSCESDCPDGTSFIRCGNECRAYYGLKKQAEEIAELRKNQVETKEEYDKMLQNEAEVIKKLKEIQKEEEEEIGKVEEKQNFLFVVFAVVLVIVFVYLIARCYSSKKKRTTVSQQSTLVEKSNQEETTPLNSNGSQDTHVRISMTAVGGSAKGIGVATGNNKQDESVTSSTSTIGEDEIKSNDNGKDQSLELTIREPANADTKAQPFITECNQDRGPDTSTKRTTEDENTDAKFSKRDEEANYSTVVVEENEADVEVTTLNRNGHQNAHFTKQTATVVTQAKGGNTPVFVSLIQQHGQVQNSGDLL